MPPSKSILDQLQRGKNVGKGQEGMFSARSGDGTARQAVKMEEGAEVRRDKMSENRGRDTLAEGKWEEHLKVGKSAFCQPG